MGRDVSLGTLAAGLLLKVYGEINMCHAVIAEGRATGKIGDVFDVARTHDAGVVNRDVRKQPVETHVLLSMRVDQIMEMMSGNRQYRLTIQFGIVQTI